MASYFMCIVSIGRIMGFIAWVAAWLAAWGAGCNHKRSCSRSANLHRLEVGQPFPFPLMIEDIVWEADKEAQK